MEVWQGNHNCNHSLKREKPARCAGIPLEPLNECCLAVKRMPLEQGEGTPKAEEYVSGCSGFDLEEVPGEGELQLPFPRHVCGLSSGQSRWKRW